MAVPFIVVKIRFKNFILIYLTCANSGEKNQIEEVKLILKQRLKHFEKCLELPILSFKGSATLYQLKEKKNFPANFCYYK